MIYTHSLEPHIAVVWSGFWNFLGVLTSSGLVAFGIISLLPVELILQVGSKAGFAMVFALLVAAISWNLATWYFGLPASSSHTLIGSIIGVGIANQLISPMLVACAQSTPARTNRNPIALTASAANASGSVQTTLSKLPRPHDLCVPAFLLRGSPDRDLSFVSTNPENWRPTSVLTVIQTPSPKLPSFLFCS